MAEMIYTHIKPVEEYVSSFYLKRRRASSTYKELSDNINSNGILYPILAPSNNQVIGRMHLGLQRMGIAIDLCLDTIPAILYSIRHKTGFKGVPITGINDIIKICGESIKNEPIYDGIIWAIKKIKQQNNYPPDPLEIKSQSDD